MSREGWNAKLCFFPFKGGFSSISVLGSDPSFHVFLYFVGLLISGNAWPILKICWSHVQGM